MTPHPTSDRAVEPRRLVVVGHVCIDENSRSGEEGTRRTAGSPAFFIDRHLARDSRVAVSIIAPYGPDLLEIDDSLPLLNGPTAPATLLYQNHLEGDQRRQRCSTAGFAAPVPLDDALTAALRDADVLMVCPLLPDLPVAYLDRVADPRIPLRVLLAQGCFRRVGADGTITEGPFENAAQVLPLFDLVLFSDEDVRDADRLALAWSAELPQTRFVVTHNRHGATAYERGLAAHVAATPLESTGDGNVVGTGDVFGAALAMACADGSDLPAAVATANRAAAHFIDSARAAV